MKLWKGSSRHYTIFVSFLAVFFMGLVCSSVAHAATQSEIIALARENLKAGQPLNNILNYFWHRSTDDKVDASRNDYAGHNLNLSASTLLFTRLGAGLEESFLLTREPASSDVLSQLVTRDKYWMNRLGPFLTYDIGEKGAVKLAYRNEALNYMGSASTVAEDSQENRSVLTLTYHLNTTNHLDLESQYWHRNFDGNVSSDYNSYQAMLIFRREFNRYLQGQIGAGYQRRDFTQKDLDPANAFTFNLGVTG